MYLLINGNKHTCSRRMVTEDSIKYLTVEPKPEEISGVIQLCRDEGFLLAEDSADSFERSTYSGTLLTLTNKPEPQPHIPTVDEVRAQCLEMISQACNQTIVAGVDVEFETGVEHFNLSNEDQNNIDNLFRIVYLGGTRFPYQADGGECRVYAVSEIAQIYVAAQTLITTQTAYHNALKKYVNSMETVEEINGVSYGMELPEPYLTDLTANLAVAREEMAALVAKLQESQNAEAV